MKNDNLEEVLSQIHPLIMDGGLQKKENLEIIQKLIQENNTVEIEYVNYKNEECFQCWMDSSVV